MKLSWIKIMKESNRLKLSKWQLFSHYSIIPFLLIIPIINLYFVFQIEVTETYTGVRSTQEHLTFGLPWLIIILIFGLIQYRRLNFTRLKTELTTEEFKSFAKQAGEEMNWIFKDLTKDYTVAITVQNGLSRGERITIIHKEKEILINSICDPNNISSLASYGQNKKNINALKKKSKSVPKTTDS
jgi:hypothetical protein